MQENLSKKFAKIKEEKDLTLTEMAKIAGVKTPAISNYLNQVRQLSISFEAIYNLCHYFGISVDDLVSAPLENFSLANLQNKDKEVQSDTVRQEIERLIDNIYNKLDDDGKIWFKVEIKKFLEKIK